MILAWYIHVKYTGIVVGYRYIYRRILLVYSYICINISQVQVYTGILVGYRCIYGILVGYRCIQVY